MYVESELIRLVSKVSKNEVNALNIEEYIEEKVLVYTLEGAKEDMELDTLEEVMSQFWIVAVGDELRFVGDEIFDEWI